MAKTVGDGGQGQRFFKAHLKPSETVQKRLLSGFPAADVVTHVQPAKTRHSGLNKMTFFLQYGIPDNKDGRQEARSFLDDRIHAGCEARDMVEADSWLTAREMLRAVDFSLIDATPAP